MESDDSLVHLHRNILIFECAMFWLRVYGNSSLILGGVCPTLNPPFANSGLQVSGQSLLALQLAPCTSFSGVCKLLITFQCSTFQSVYSAHWVIAFCSWGIGTLNTRTSVYQLVVQNAPCLSRFNISARPISDAQPATVVEPIVTIGKSVECVQQLSTCAVTCQLSLHSWFSLRVYMCSVHARR